VVFGVFFCLVSWRVVAGEGRRGGGREREKRDSQGESMNERVLLFSPIVRSGGLLLTYHHKKGE